LELIRAGTVDLPLRFRQHVFIMAETLLESPRRSSRVFKRVLVNAEGKNLMGRKFRESCQTIVINAHGALLYLKAELAVGAMVVLSNPFTQEDQECRVVFIGDDVEKGQRVGVEFLSPAPHFWGVDFTPPEDWLKHKYDASPDHHSN
jgi:PilZ domain